jgi:DNA polymerase III subunit gamma/tau
VNLSERVRPPNFDDVVGNADVVANLRALSSKEHPPHAFLLIGPPGCGKTTLGRIIALALGVRREDVLAQTGDYRELDNASFRGIDTIRDIRDGAGYVGLHGVRRCWLLDEVHGLGKLQQDALLKLLENPPSHAYFVLCTTEPESLRETIRSRCSIHRVSPLSESDMVRLLHRIASGEGGSAITRRLYGTIHEKAEGKPRAAIQLLEKVLAADPGSRDGIVAEHEAVKEKADSLARALYQRTGWKAVSSILNQIENDDVETTRQSVLGYCWAVLLRGEDDHAMGIVDQMVEPFFSSGKFGLRHACYLIMKGDRE